MFKEKIEQIDEKKKKLFIEQGKKFAKKDSILGVGASRDYFKEAGFKEEEEVDMAIKLLRMIGITEEEKEELEEKRHKEMVKLTPEDKAKLAQLGSDSIRREDFYFAALCFKGAGYSNEVTKPLFSLAKDWKEIEARSQESKRKKIELSLRDKLNLKDLGLVFMVKKELDAAETCLKEAGIEDEEIESLKALNLLGIDKERDKISEELAKLKMGEKK